MTGNKIEQNKTIVHYRFLFPIISFLSDKLHAIIYFSHPNFKLSYLPFLLETHSLTISLSTIFVFDRSFCNLSRK